VRRAWPLFSPFPWPRFKRCQAHHRTPLPLPYPQELPGVVTVHRDALAAVENPRPKAFSTTHCHQAGMVSPAAPRIPGRAPQGSWVLVPTASPRLIGRATGYSCAIAGVRCAVTTRRPRRATSSGRLGRLPGHGLSQAGHTSGLGLPCTAGRHGRWIEAVG
jgi:hypothetical protein